MELYFVTGNKHKFAEAQRILPQLQQMDIDLDEIQSLDQKEVIQHKLRQAQQHFKGCLIVEDTSLTFSSLHQLPGTLIKWFLQTLDLQKLSQLAGNEDRAATAQVTLGLQVNEKEPVFFTATVQGTIVSPCGENGFGWDAIFMPDGSDKTFAEMTALEKQAFNMRAKTLEQVKEYLRKVELL